MDFDLLLSNHNALSDRLDDLALLLDR